MVEFKKNIKTLLPYDREVYIDYLGYEFYKYPKWYGVSFQLPGGFEGREIGLTEYLEAYENWFKNIILQLDDNTYWIVNHDTKDMDWFPYEEDTLTSLRALFKQNSIPNKFKGAIVFTTRELLEFTRDLITYPFALFKKDSLLYNEGFLYNDLDISHGTLPLIIKISHHSDIDLLSTDTELLKKVVNENSPDHFILRNYNGISL
jgi:hypothetical protein